MKEPLLIQALGRIGNIIHLAWLKNCWCFSVENGRCLLTIKDVAFLNNGVTMCDDTANSHTDRQGPFQILR